MIGQFSMMESTNIFVSLLFLPYFLDSDYSDANGTLFKNLTIMSRSVTFVPFKKILTSSILIEITHLI